MFTPPCQQEVSYDRQVKRLSLTNTDNMYELAYYNQIVACETADILERDQSRNVLFKITSPSMQNLS